MKEMVHFRKSLWQETNKGGKDAEGGVCNFKSIDIEPIERTFL